MFHIRTQRTGGARGPEPFFLFPREIEAAILPRMTAVSSSCDRRDCYPPIEGTSGISVALLFRGEQLPSAERPVQMAASHSGICSISF